MKRPLYINPNAKVRSAAQVEKDAKADLPVRKRSQPAAEHASSVDVEDVARKMRTV